MCLLTAAPGRAARWRRKVGMGAPPSPALRRLARCRSLARRRGLLVVSTSSAPPRLAHRPHLLCVAFALLAAAAPLRRHLRASVAGGSTVSARRDANGSRRLVSVTDKVCGEEKPSKPACRGGVVPHIWPMGRSGGGI
jgi:hypothetical protein